MKLRTIGMAAVAALALVAGRAEAQDAAAAPAPAPAASQDAGWDTGYGILFTIPNLFQNGSSQVIGEFGTEVTTGSRLATTLDPTFPGFVDGKIGIQKNLSPTNALRLGLSLSRFSEGITETSSAGVTAKVVPALTSAIAAELSAQYLVRLTQAAVAPYVGAGVSVGYARAAKKGKDEVSGVPGYVDYDNKWSALDFGINASLGLEWRIHKVIAFFAEYQADLTLASTFKGNISEKDSDGVTILLTEQESKEKHFFNLDTGIAQGGQLGIIAFF